VTLGFWNPVIKKGESRDIKLFFSFLKTPKLKHLLIKKFIKPFTIIYAQMSSFTHYLHPLCWLGI